MFQDTDTAGVVAVDNIFEGKEFCVMNGDRNEYQKHAMETLIVQHGGTKVQCPLYTTFCAVALKESIKVQNLMKRADIDIVHPKWLLACVAEGKLLPCEPKYMLYTTEETKSNMLLHIDKYGESYAVDTTVESLQEVFEQMDKLKSEEKGEEGEQLNEEHEKHLAHLQILDIESNKFENKPWWGMFRNYVVYVDRYYEVGGETTAIQFCSLELTQQLLEFYGATIATSLKESVTHVVLDRADLTRLGNIKSTVSKMFQKPPHKTKYVVGKEWVAECVSQQEDLDEREFFV